MTAILVVDDSLTVRMDLVDALDAAGFRAVGCATLAEARDALRSQVIALAILDVLLPDGDGIVFLEELRADARYAELPILMLSSEVEVKDRIRGLRMGANDYVGKPYDTAATIERIRQLLRRKQFEDEHRGAREELLRRAHEAVEARVARELVETRTAFVEQLERSNRDLAAANRELGTANRELGTANRELEAFSYSVSHDLRARLRSIDGFTRAIEEDGGDQLDATCRGHLGRVRAAAAQMSELIEALLALSRIGRARLSRSSVDVSAIASAVLDELRRREPDRDVEATVHPALRANADGKLVKVLLDNVLGNAWKFTSRRPRGHVEVGVVVDQGEPIFFVRDDGAGFDGARAAGLFAPFHRLHSEAEFKGTGIGLATVQRIIERHGGRIWVQAAVDAGATFYFTLPAAG